MNASGKQEILQSLKNEGILCGKLFSNITQPSSKLYNSEYYELYDDDEIKSIFENNAYIFYKDIYCLNNVYEGLSLYEFDNNDVFALTPDQFLSIPMKPLSDQVCIIWLDNNKQDRYQRFKLEGRDYNFNDKNKVEQINQEDFINNLYNFPKSKLLYFCNEDPQRIAMIIYAMIKHPDLVDKFVKKFN